MLSRPFRVLCLAGLMLSVATGANAGEAAPKRLALILYEKGSPDRILVRDFLSAFDEIDGRVDAISVLSDGELTDRVGPAYIDAAVACGADLRCIAGLGAKAGATHVLFGRASAEKGGVAMQWLLVDVGSGGIVGKLKAKVTAAAGPKAAAEQVARELLGLTAEDLERPVAKPAPAEAAPGETAAAPPPPAAPGSFRRGPAVVGGAALACGALAIGAGVIASHDGHGSRANAFIAAGEALAVTGAAVWTWEWLRITPVAAFDGRSGFVGVAASW